MLHDTGKYRGDGRWVQQGCRPARPRPVHVLHPHTDPALAPGVPMHPPLPPAENNYAQHNSTRSLLVVASALSSPVAHLRPTPSWPSGPTQPLACKRPMHTHTHLHPRPTIALQSLVRYALVRAGARRGATRHRRCSKQLSAGAARAGGASSRLPAPTQHHRLGMSFSSRIC